MDIAFVPPVVHLLEALRRSLRQFSREPLYYFGSALTLALAVAAAVASIAVVKPALFDPLPYRGGHELVLLRTMVQGSTSAVSPHVLNDLQDAASPLREFAAIRPSGVSWTAAESTENVSANLVSASYFSLLGARPSAGRFFTEGEADTVVISWTFWQTSLGGDPSAVGRSLRLNERDRTIVGIMAPAFVAPYWPNTEVWLPLDLAALLGDPRGRRSLTVLARRSAPLPAVDEFLTLFADRMRLEHPALHGQQSWVARPLRDELVGPAAPALLGTAAAAVLLLLTVCANLVGLSAVRAIGRRQQIAVRTALGATSGRLRLDRLGDGLTIAGGGSLLGVGLGAVLVSILAGFQPQFLERVSAIRLDLTTAVLGVAAGLVVGLVTAVAPLHGSTPEPGHGLMGRSRAASGDTSTRALRSGLVVCQVAFAFVLMVGAGLLVQTVRHIAETDLGFQSEGWSTFGVALSPRYDTEEKQIQFERDATAELRRIPGVKAAHASVGVPVIGGMGAALRIFGEPNTAALSEIAYMSVAPGFLEGMGVALKAGRLLSESDRAGAPDVVVVNETMARAYWPAGDAVGARVQIGPGTDVPWMTVVGVVADVRQHGPTQRVRASAFGTTLQYSFPRRNFVLRTDQRLPSLAGDIRAAIRRVDPAQPIDQLRTFDELVADRTARHRLVMLALSGFGLVALVLSAFGLYAVVALTSRLRRREYAIRVALGADGQRVRRLVLSQGLRLAGLGVLAGVLLAAAGTRGLSGMLLGVAPLDQGTFASTIAIVLTMAAFAALGPALQAARVDPAEALKAE